MAKFEEARTHFAEGGAKTVDDALAQLMLQPDKRAIGGLLMALDDSAKDDAGMFSIIHAAEHFDDCTYVGEMLTVLPQLCAKAPKWASIVFIRCLNNEEAKNHLMKLLHNADPRLKEPVAWLCQKINDRSPIFLSRTVPIMLAARQDIR